MSLEVYGGGDEEDLCAAVEPFGWSLGLDGKWRQNDDHTEELTDEQMWHWLEDKRAGDQQDYAEWDARDVPT